MLELVYHCSTFATMPEKVYIRDTTPVRVKKELKNKVQQHVQKTRQSIGGFFEIAAEKELARLKKGGKK